MWIWVSWVRVPLPTPFTGTANPLGLAVPAILGHRQAVRQRTLTPSLRWFESSWPNQNSPDCSGTLQSGLFLFPWALHLQQDIWYTVKNGAMRTVGCTTGRKTERGPRAYGGQETAAAGQKESMGTGCGCAGALRRGSMGCACPACCPCKQQRGKQRAGKQRAGRQRADGAK